MARARARGRRPSRSATRCGPARTTCSTSAAARTASRRSSRATSRRRRSRCARRSDGGAALLAVCGGYQLLGRGYRDRHGEELPGRRAVSARHRRGRAADDRRRPARVRARAGRRRTLAGFENHAGRTTPRRGRGAARPRRRRLRQRRRERLRGLPRRPRDRHVPARAAPAAQSLARGLAARAGDRARDRRRAARARAARRTSSRREAHEVSARAGPVARRPLLAGAGSSSTTREVFFRHLAAVDFGALGDRTRFSGAAVDREDARVAEHHCRRRTRRRACAGDTCSARISAASA